MDAVTSGKSYDVISYLSRGNMVIEDEYRKELYEICKKLVGV